MIDFTTRLVHAPDTDARMRQVVSLAPSSALARLGLVRRSSAMEMALSYGGAIAFGALVGAGAALLLAPTTGKELQSKLRQQAKRVSRDAKKASDRVEEVVSEGRERVSTNSHSDGISPSSNDKHRDAHA